MKELKGVSTAAAKKTINKVVFACDAGMGSSAMGPPPWCNKCKKAGLALEVVHCAIENIPKDADMVVTHEKLAARAKAAAPQAELIPR